MADYPKWKYHEELDAAVVKSAEEEKALGQGWYESPADCPKNQPIKEVKPQVKAKK